MAFSPAKKRWRTKWRREHPQERNRQRSEYYRRFQNGDEYSRHAGKVWATEEIALIITPDRPSDPILARKLGRSVQAIQNKRLKSRARMR
jgi:hypothetical protein